MSENEIRIPVMRVDHRGRITCPTCGDFGEVPANRYLTVGVKGWEPMVCENGHAFIITEEAARITNEILSKSLDGNWRKDVLKSYTEGPKPKDGGSVIP